jgi:2-keto-3-deoxy-L-rhamnonate aldolase RhmA
MPRIKQLLAEGQVVRVFAAGQILSPKLIEIVGEHGEFDALWLDFEHAGISMKEIELATMAAKAYGMDHFVRLPATDYASVMRPLEAGAGGADDQHGPLRQARPSRRSAGRSSGHGANAGSTAGIATAGSA